MQFFHDLLGSELFNDEPFGTAWAGEDAPEPAWALLSAIEALDRDAESSRY